MNHKFGLYVFTSTMAVFAQTPCASLKSLSFPNTTITLVEEVATGPFQRRTPEGGPPAEPFTLPAHCRVAMVLAPSAGSHILSEIWLPANWNGNFQVVGIGGFAGSINRAGLAEGTARGYATATTDTGHQERSAAFGLQPEKVIDFAYRAFHETTVKAKSIVTTFYGRRPSYSYWNGCSGGGGQGLMEAWRYPDDFDGILAGAPGSVFNLDALYWWAAVAQTAHRTPDAWIPKSKLPLIHQAALQACDARDGIKDGVIQDPTRCGFDPAVLKCTAGDGPDCLTDSQVATAHQAYSPVTDPATKKPFFAGLMPGSELGWARQVGEAPYGLATEPLKYLFFKDPQWDYRSLDLGSRTTTAGKVASGLDSLHQPDLRPFFKKGGKLLLYHGWNDQALPPESSVQYYKSVVEAVGPINTPSMRLFLFPGMAHCGGGEGPNQFDALGALKAWVEQRKAPDSLIASHATNGKVDRTRPVCAYPQVAVYKGSGSTDEAANFSCQAPALK